jgi:hypothetical protein
MHRFPWAVGLFLFVFFSTAGAAKSAIRIDLTGNWREGGEKAPPFAVRTHEPALKSGERKTFWQEIDGIGEDCMLELDYLPALDTDPDHPGHAIENRFDRFEGLTINSKAVSQLKWVKRSEGSYRLTCALKAPAGDAPLRLEFSWHYPRPPRTRLILKNPPVKGSVYQALKPAQSGELLIAHGIPFLAGRVSYDRNTWIAPWGAWLGRSGALGGPTPAAGLAVAYDGSQRLDAADVEVKTIHFLGMIHLLDWGNGSWYTPKGDHRSSHFVGDKAGAIVLTFADGTETEIPLIFGWNLWYSRPWDMVWHFNMWGGRATNYGDTLFGGDAKKLQLIPDALALVDGIRPRGATSSNARFIFSVALEGKRLRSVAMKNAPELNYGPVVSAATIETDRPTPKLQTLPLLARGPANVKITTLDDIARKTYEPGVRRLMHLLYTFADELPALKKPDVPKGYFGPRYDFGPERDAVYAATLLYHNGPACAAFIADSGMGCASPVFPGMLTGNYTECTGIWVSAVPHFKSLPKWFAAYGRAEPGKFPGLGQAWSRSVGELMRESMAFGYDKFIHRYTEWLDAGLYERLNPPHWTRVVGMPEFAAENRKVGDIEERGNRENDGHGICMWGRGMVWHWLGRPRDWNERHWKATVDSVEWIQWQLDTSPVFPGNRNDVLFTESECAHGTYDIYSSYNCLHGIKWAIRMAEQLGKAEKANRWQALYARLRQGILDHLVDQSDFGPIWHTYPHCDWQDHAHKLVHLHLATEGDTYTPLQDYAKGDELDRKYLEISRNTYRYLMRTKDYNCLRMYGYGQGMMTQAALLLDEMNDAERFLDMLVRHAYLPNLGGWGSPEGIITHRSGKYYLAVNGYQGQDSHIADSTKALRLMLGVDDNDPAHLRVIPRFPATWSNLSIADYPALTGGQRQKLGYSYRRTANRQEFSLHLEREAGPISVRLGPLPGEKRIASVTLNGRSTSFREEHSGDSRWAWAEIPGGTESKIIIRFVP